MSGGLPLRLLDDLAPRLLRARGFRRRYVPSPLGALHVLDARGHGPGDRLVVVHGLGSSAADYAWGLAGLRRYVSWLTLVDLPGHGASPDPGADVDLDHLWRSVAEVLDAVTGPSFALFGNSLGGFVAARYAAANPARVTRLVLVSPGGAPMDGPAMRQFWEGFRFADHAAARDFVGRFLARPGVEVPLLAAGVRVRMAQPTVRALLDRSEPRHLLRPEELARLRMPTLCIWGRGDRVLPESHRAFFRDHLPPGARFEEPAHYGHAPFLDANRDFVRRVGRFLTEEAGPVAARRRRADGSTR